MAVENKSLARTKTTPIETVRSIRRQGVRSMTSMPAGKMVPICAFGMLREDAVQNGTLRLNFESMETAEILMNAINVNVKAYLVPHLAFERFNNSMDSLNRSYEGVPDKVGQPVTPYIETEAYGAQKSNQILYYMGKHGAPTDQVNTAYTEAYNIIWNFRAKNRSLDLTLRSRLEKTLAPAFWQHSQFAHIVPDFDQAVIDGEVALNVANARMPVRGIYRNASGNGVQMAATTTNERDAAAANRPAGRYTDFSTENPDYTVRMAIRQFNTTTFVPDIYAELQNNGITLSLSNIEMAKKTQAFARMREHYNGHDDEYIINLLMDGITIPEQQWMQPILLADKNTVFGMAKRYASDGANLTESVVNGATYLDLVLRLPRVPCGGVVMVVAEITPEQLFERQRDIYLHTKTVSELPAYLRDTLDPEKVEVVKNGYIDAAHSTPNGAFGYAPLNHAWNSLPPGIGGKFFRADPNEGFKEDRQRIWAVETVNPALGADFYITTAIHTKPFVVTNQDPFECLCVGEVAISGNTVFGGTLVEEMNNYDKVMLEAPQDRIVKV